MQRLQMTKGYSLLEVLVAVSILLLSIVSPLTIAAKGIEAGYYARQQETAIFLAQEGIEAFTSLRNQYAITDVKSGSTNSWNDFLTAIDTSAAACKSATGCDIDFRDSVPFSHTVSCSPVSNCVLNYNESNARDWYTHVAGGTVSPYTRVITLVFDNANNGLYVQSTVTWKGTLFGTAAPQTVTLTSALYKDTI